MVLRWSMELEWLEWSRFARVIFRNSQRTRCQSDAPRLRLVLVVWWTPADPFCWGERHENYHFNPFQTSREAPFLGSLKLEQPPWIGHVYVYIGHRPTFLDFWLTSHALRHPRRTRQPACSLRMTTTVIASFRAVTGERSIGQRWPVPPGSCLIAGKAW